MGQPHCSVLPHLPEPSLLSLLAFKSSGPYPGLLSARLGATKGLAWTSEGLLCPVDLPHAEWGCGGHTGAPAHTLGGLAPTLDPLAQVIEPTKTGLPSKKCKACPWTQKTSPEELGRSVSRRDGDPGRGQVGRWRAGRRASQGGQRVRRVRAEEQRGRKGQIRWEGLGRRGS